MDLAQAAEHPQQISRCPRPIRRSPCNFRIHLLAMSRVIGFLVTITNAQEKPTVRCRVFGEKVKWGDDMKNWDRDVEQDHDFLCWVNRRLLKRYIFFAPA
jgi:hypothetical protein